jgi:hypothetical protein
MIEPVAVSGRTKFLLAGNGLTAAVFTDGLSKPWLAPRYPPPHQSHRFGKHPSQSLFEKSRKGDFRSGTGPLPHPATLRYCRWVAGWGSGPVRR